VAPVTDPVLRVQAQLTDRDHVLLGWLADHGVLTSFQIATALFPSLDYAQDRLRTLTDLVVLDRFRPQKPDGGSYPYHYVLAQLGGEVVAAQRGDEPPRRDQARQRRRYLTARANLPHLLGVNGFFTDLAGYARIHPGCALVRWWPAGLCQRMGAFAEAGGDNIDAQVYTPRIRPDGHGIWADHDRQVSFFLEYDTGTERPLWRLLDKLDGYRDLARVVGRIWPVLFWLHSPARERHFHHALTDAGIRYPVATATVGGCPAEAVWWLHRQDGDRLRLAAIADRLPDTATAGRS
jgi:Replication-relaxation